MKRDDLEIIASIAELRAELRELAAGQRAILDAIEAAREPTRPLRFEDRASMARVLPVLAGHFAGSFAVWELLDRLGGNDALAANLRLVIGKRTAQQLGKLFSRCADHD